MTPGNHAFTPGEIAPDQDIRKPCFAAERGDQFALIVADFEGEEAMLGEQASGPPKDRPIRGKPVRTAIERGERIVLVNLCRQFRDRCAPYVGRVRDDNVEGPFRPLCEIDFYEAHAVGDTMCLGIRARRGKRLLGDVGRNGARFFELGEKRNRNRARSRSKIAES